jgi:predicted esterase
MGKLRILCLHGYHGSADILRGQMTALVAGLPPLADFICVDAPSLANGDFGWWHAVDDGPQNAADRGTPLRTVRYQGWPTTRDWIISLFDRERFDGVFGFSQGAALAALLVGMRSPTGTASQRHPLSFDFAMLVGGFTSNDPSHAGLYDPESFDLPSLHVIGRSDTVVPSPSSCALASRFKNPVVVQHEGGHVVASDPGTLRQVSVFLEARSTAADARALETSRTSS